MLRELPGHVGELLVRELDPDPAPRRAGVDPTAVLPAASVASTAKAPRVTGSRERPAPLPLNVVDLTAPARYGTVHDEFGDQIGEQAVMSILDIWVRDIRGHRGRGEGLPLLSVQHLVDWLLVRHDDTCDDFPAIADLAGDVKHLHGVLRAQLGLTGPEVDVKAGVSCPKCDRQELFQHAGSDRIECHNCPMLLTIDEFDRWCRLSSVNLIHIRGVFCKDCGKENFYRFKGTAMSYCGWCEWHPLIREAS